MPTKQPRPAAIDPDDTVPNGAGAASLGRVLDKSEQIKQVVEECAEELSAVNSALTNELDHGLSQAGVGVALGKVETVEAKVLDCASDLTNVTQALGVHVGERQELDEHVIAVRKEALQARHAASHDPLTLLANRAMFDERLEQGLAQARRHGRTLGVLFIDLDGFKSVNDTYGHAAGDKVLKQVARRLLAMARREDTVSRHGGDEFLYLLNELNDEGDALAVAARVVGALSKESDVGTQDGEIHRVVAPSVGIAVYPTDGTTAQALLAKADAAMYRAKRSKAGYSLAR